MLSQVERKRVFFGYEVQAPWPAKYPSGRVLDPSSRHMTLAFLGNVDYPPLQDLLSSFPLPSFQVGSAGYFDRCLFLPENRSHVVAWHGQSYENEREAFSQYPHTVLDWLHSHGYPIETRSFLPHTTIARSPFDREEWKQSFAPLPFIITAIHLYESVGNLVYKPIWSHPLIPPFAEFDHTADIAFKIQAESMKALHLHAQTALAFKYPLLLPFMEQIPLRTELDDIVISLNRLITLADCSVGCPLKAVSFHGSLQENEGIYSWEMIVDV